MSELEANKALVRRYYDEVLNNRKLSLMDELFSEKFLFHAASGGEGGLDKYKNALKATHAGFPDLLVAIEDQIAENDKVVTRWGGQATHIGPYFGITGTKRRVHFTAIHIHRIAEGKIVEFWEQIDLHGMMNQVGLKAKL